MRDYRLGMLFLMVVLSVTPYPLSVTKCFAQETFTITTYYPSPYGSYQDLETKRRLTIGGPVNWGGNDYGTIRFLYSTGYIDLRSATSGITGGHALAVDLQNNDNSLLEIIRQSVGPVAGIKANGNAWFNGNVGIGTMDSTNARLQINSTSAVVGNIGIGGPANRDMWFNGGTDGIFVFYNTGVASGATVFSYDPDPPGGGVELMRINNNGNVGIGIPNPGAKLDVNGNLNLMGNLQFTASDTTILRVGTSRFSIGGAKWTDVEELISPDRGTLWITGLYNAKTDRGIMFRTRGGIGAGGPPLVDRLAIGARDGQGAAGITSYEPLRVVATTDSYFMGNVAIGGRNPFSYRLYVYGTAYATGGWRQPSDLRLKKNVEKLSNVLKKLENVNAVRFDWRVDEFPDKGLFAGKQIGIVAQEIEKEFPELVNTDGQGYKAFAYDRFTAVLLEAIKEQQGQIDSLKKEISELKTKSL